MKRLLPRDYALLMAGLLSFVSVPAYAAAQGGTGSPSANSNLGTTPPRQIGIKLRLDLLTS
jgi:hypothetical protein